MKVFHINTLKKGLILHPFLFAVFPPLFLYVQNIEQVGFVDILMPTTIILCLALLLFFLAWLVLRNAKKAGIIVSLLLLLNFSYGYAIGFLIKTWQIGNFYVAGILVGTPRRYLFIIGGVLFILGVYIVIRKLRDLRNFTNFLNVVSLTLVVISIINITIFNLREPSLTDEDIKRPQDAEISALTTETKMYRDIYYIILDRYPSASALKEFRNFDNSEFINYLESKGFYVASQSKSNYGWTAHSLASSLNMKYVNYLSDIVGKKSSNWYPIYSLLQDHEVYRLLKPHGYKYIHLGSWWGPTRKARNADVNLIYSPLPEFTWTLYNTTAFATIANHFGIIFDQRLLHAKTILYQFEKISEIPSFEEPTFVFAHILIPHGPIVFDQDGRFITEEEEKTKSVTENFVNQVIFANKKIQEVVNKLLANSKVAPIIILQADEGPRLSTELRERMSILNAYYLPGVGKSVLYPSVTPVNSFRLIFNLYFNANFELLPDESYFNTYQEPYNFVNITNQFNTP